MKKNIASVLLPLVLIVVMLNFGCKKENPTTAPTITTSAPTSVRATLAVCGGAITSVGGELIKSQGICWSTTANPTISGLKIVDDSGLRTFTILLNGLSETTTYHVRAYATNIVGTSYGEDISFTTSAIPVPIVTTTAVSSISYTTATSGGVITSDGGAAIIAKGVCWSTSADPTIADSKTENGTTIESFSSSITGLTPATAYHVRSYATNSSGTAYGADLTFTTPVIPTGVPSVTTIAISSINATSAISGGIVLSDGGVAISAKGVCWSLTNNPTIADSKTTDGTGSANFVSNITGLNSYTTYYVRAYATNSVGTSYGSPISFKTLAVVSTQAENMLLGNPSGAITNILSPDNYYMEKSQYSLSYNNSKLTSNWVSWRVCSADISQAAARQDDYREDQTLPASWFHITVINNFSIYTGSGFDRGHMCPAADRSSSADNISATFFMTNMIPQAPQNNQGAWEGLETYERTLVNAGNEIYVITGPYGQGGTGSNGSANYVGSVVGQQAVVPSYTWKIVVVLSVGENDISRITSTTRVIAVWMPNTQIGTSKDWTPYRKSVDYIESQTGYDFLSNVPTGVQSVIEANVDNL